MASCLVHTHTAFRKAVEQIRRVFEDEIILLISP